MFSNISHHSRRKLNRNESEEKYAKKRKQYKMMFPLNIKEPNYSLAVSVVTVKTSNIYDFPMPGGIMNVCSEN